MNQHIDTWTPGRVVEAIEKGWTLPNDWREILERGGYTLPPEQLSLAEDA